MSHPRSIWLAFIACALLGLGGLAVISRHAMRLEEDRRAVAEAMELSRSVRLALWRMDSEASALLMRENSRPPAIFRETQIPSNAPAYARAYFEINENGALSSAAPTDPAVKGELRRLLGVTDAPMVAVVEPQVLMPSNGNADLQKAQLAYAAANAVTLNQPENFDVLPAIKESSDAASMQQVRSKDAPPLAAKQMLEKVPDDKVAAASKIKPSAAPARRMGEQTKGNNYRDSAVEQADANEFNKRAQAVQQATNRAFDNTGNWSAAPEAPDPFAAQSIPPFVPPPLEIGVTAFQPIWLEGELFLVRAAGPEARRRVQGIWLDSAALARSLLDGIGDLLDGALLEPYEPFAYARETVIRGDGAAELVESRLRAIPSSLGNAPMALLSLPWELVPGKPALTLAGASPLPLLLGLAWGGAALGLLAAALLLRGVLQLSERRAAFVSSVTHELRTPLTTFSLYSEMLADGMVAEPAQQQEYLHTLRRESGRLAHLVENVLAYSRLERGSARARVEDIRFDMLLDRVLSRPRERAAAAGTAVSIRCSDESAVLRTDAGAVEQILFNLVDNAAKYAPPAEGGEPWELTTGCDSRSCWIDFRDHGPGIGKRDRGRLFRPFHKSAEEAANTKPGVGLGLALSRRLARALGGDLILRETGPTGSTFRLKLPRA
ncbi:MAG: sensor histidine kinase [Verrucomicrobiales bacterium]